MQPTWRIPEEIEKPFRTALTHATTRNIDELHSLLDSLSKEQLEGSVGLCGLASAYTAIDVTERKWPTDAQVRRMAQGITEGKNPDKQHGVTEQNLYLWLSQCALGSGNYADVFDSIFEDPHQYMAAPFFFTTNLLIRFKPKDKSETEFLSLIEAAYEGAWQLDLNLLPALMVRARMPQAGQASGL